MKEYKYVSADVKGLQLTYKKVKENYKEIVNQHAAQGWRLVQVLDFPDGTTEIIFEKDI
jgi:hypothetical protein